MPRASDGNRCRASEIEDLGLTAAQARPRRGATAPETPKARNNSAPPIPAARRSPRVEESVNKLRSMDDKVEILRRYSEWVAGGKVKSECPNRDLVEQYGCSINEPKRLYDKVLETGTVDNNWHQREQGYPDAIWDEMVTIIREHRSRGRDPGRSQKCLEGHHRRDGGQNFEESAPEYAQSDRSERRQLLS